MGDAAIACPDLLFKVNLDVLSASTGSSLWCYHFTSPDSSAAMEALATQQGVPACDGFYVLNPSRPGIVRLCQLVGGKCKPQAERHCMQARGVTGAHHAA